MTHRLPTLLCSVLLLTSGAAVFGAEELAPRPLAVEDYFNIRDVGDPRISPDGEWVAYTVTSHDLEEDETRSQVWMVPTAGGDAVPMTAENESSSRPRWSPDGKYLAFLSARGDDRKDDEEDDKEQVWTLFRQGGEAIQLTDTAQGVSAYEWSPSGDRMVIVLQDPTPEELEAKEKGQDYEEKTPRPWVVNRQQFKQDYVGYLDSRRTHLYIVDLESQEISQLTGGDFDDSEPAWSPDGSKIAFTSNRTQTPDDNYNTDIWVVAADPAASGDPVRVSSSAGPDASPAWSPDGQLIVHTSVTDVAAMLYATQHLAVSASNGGGTRVLTQELDRMIFRPRFSLDGRSVYFLLEDSGEQNLARISAGGGGLERVVRGPRVVQGFDLAAGGVTVVRVGEPHLPAELFTVSNGDLQRLTYTNDEVLTGIRLGEVDKVRFASQDGTSIESFVIKPPGFVEGTRYPAVLRIHGGPQSQYDFDFYFVQQLFAAQGYVVVMPNPRGSTGYGQEFCLGIWQAWGEPDYEDVMAAVDYVIARGWADPERLAVSGWSYGGMLTNHVITKTDRFKAAATGASATLYVVNYGHDQYQRWWEQELGQPWKPEARQLYERLSPFNRVDRVVTPTLILGGEKDWNVPIINSEQLYLALLRLGVDTELVVYPGEYHGIDTPSYAKDLYQRYLDWFAKYLGGGNQETHPAAK
jgi:dipeptidyl aminopeptidase/acylaminoacyl peptidase